MAAIRALRTAKALHAFEVKRSSVFRESDLDGLRLFCADYPSAAGHLFYGGTKRYRFDAIDVVPIAEGIAGLEAGRFVFWWTCRAGSMYESGGYAFDAAPALFGVEVGGVCGP